MQRALGILGLAALLAPPLGAQALSELEPGTRLRITARAEQLRNTEGALLGWKQDTIVFGALRSRLAGGHRVVHDTTVVEVPLAAVDRIEERYRGVTASGVLRSGARGALAGGFALALLGAAVADPDNCGYGTPCNGPGGFVAGAVVGGAAGFVVGMVFGFIPQEQWRAVRLDRPGVSLAPYVTADRVGLGASVRF